jgi:PilZ domain
MNRNGKAHQPPLSGRTSPRVNTLREITVSYEGQDEQIVVKPPNLSKRGMFINTARVFPEGAVLNLQFSLLLTGAEIRTRCEVRYCHPGVGVGVEFVGLPSSDRKIIEREIARSEERTRTRKAPARTKKIPTRVPRKRRIR